MRILHTGDWHVGKLMRGRSRADEHREVLAEITGLASGYDVDLVVVAGDLFETSAPTAESEQIVYRALLALAATGAEVVVVAGNHDNARRLQAVAPVFGLGRVHVAAELARPDEGGVLRVETPAGETAAIALVPFVSQRGIVRADDLLTGGTDERAPRYAHRVQRVVEALTVGFSPDTVNLVVAHLFVAGGVLGGGERSAHTIFEYWVPPSVFPADAQYVALGHLHRAQDLAAACPVRYAGSPLQLDFGESEDAKSVTLVDAAPGAPAAVTQLELTSGRRLRTIEGTLDELEARVDTTGDDWLRVRVHEPLSVGLGDRVRELFPNAVDVEIVRPEHEVETGPRARRRTEHETPVELFDEYLAEQQVDDERLPALFAELLDEVGG